MAYIDLDEINRLHPKLTAKYPLSFANGISVAVSEINRLPNADVVPKSEYDAVVSAVDNSTKEFLKLHDDYQRQLEKNQKLHSQMAKYQLELQNSKSEVCGFSAEELAQKIENLSIENDAMRGAANSYKMHYENAMKEIERLKDYNIGVAFKHYFDGRKEVAREIFAEIEAKAPWFCENQTAYEHFNEELAELKKKYEVQNDG